MSAEDQNYFLPYAFIDDIENDNKEIHQYSEYDEQEKENYVDDEKEENINIGSDIKNVVNKIKIKDNNERINKRYKINKNIKKIKKDLIFNKSLKEDFNNEDETEEQETEKCFNDLDKEYLIYGLVIGILVIFISNVIYKIK